MSISSKEIILFLLLGELYFRYASIKLNRLQLEDYWVKVDYFSVISYTMILQINKNVLMNYQNQAVLMSHFIIR
jgi:hypothetical protein